MNESVKTFYDINPYPNIFTIARVKPARLLFELACNKVSKPIPDKPRILIVGCGTIATEAIACAYPQAEIICAIDISPNTIDISKKRCRNIKNTNIVWINGDISDENILEKLPVNEFDWIHCTGVLHHLYNPEDGIKNLSKLLKQDGIIKAQFYSKGARVFIEWARSAFLFQKAQNIRDIKDILVALTKHHPFHYVLATYPESITLSGLTDGFLHPQVKCYYAKDWNSLLNNHNLSVEYWDNLHYFSDIDDILPVKYMETFNLNKIQEKITFLEMIGEWRSDFNTIITKSKEGITPMQQDNSSTDYTISPTDNFSFPRNYLWQETKAALKTLKIELTKDELRHILTNLNNKEWLRGYKSLLLRYKWSSWSNKALLNASLNHIFSKKIDELFENYYDEETIYIPTTDYWSWQQYEYGFFLWKWV